MCRFSGATLLPGNAGLCGDTPDNFTVLQFEGHLSTPYALQGLYNQQCTACCNSACPQLALMCMCNAPSSSHVAAALGLHAHAALLDSQAAHCSLVKCTPSWWSESVRLCARMLTGPGHGMCCVQAHMLPLTTARNADPTSIVSTIITSSSAWSLHDQAADSSTTNVDHSTQHTWCRWHPLGCDKHSQLLPVDVKLVCSRLRNGGTAADDQLPGGRL